MRKSFKAACKLPVPVPVQDLTEDQEKVRAATAVKHKGEWCALVPHEHEFTDPYLFDQHMADVHDKKPSNGENYSLVRRAQGRWKGPRLTDEGKPFEPTGLEPGAAVSWRELVGTGVFRTETYSFAGQETTQRVEGREWVERTGQVWSGAPYPKAAWVVPFEPREGEFAVLVREDRLSGGLKAQQTWTRTGYKDAA